MTTRPRREGETNGVEYFFVSKDQFEQKIKEDAFVEYATFVGNYYGTPREYIEQQRNLGKNVLLEIECDGAIQLINKFDDLETIFILPPSISELKNRLINRGTESIETINKRVTKAESEMELSKHYKFSVINDDADRAADELKNHISNLIKKSN